MSVRCGSALCRCPGHRSASCEVYTRESPLGADLCSPSYCPTRRSLEPWGYGFVPSSEHQCNVTVPSSQKYSLETIWSARSLCQVIQPVQWQTHEIQLTAVARSSSGVSGKKLRPRNTGLIPRLRLRATESFIHLELSRQPTLSLRFLKLIKSNLHTLIKIGIQRNAPFREECRQE